MALEIEYYKEKNSDFYMKTGIICWYEDLENLGLTPRTVTGTFIAPDVPTLQKFCEQNPQYHIVSTISELKKVNKYLPGNHTYKLANGDSNPDLEIVYPPEMIEHVASEIMLIAKRVKPDLGF